MSRGTQTFLEFTSPSCGGCLSSMRRGMTGSRHGQGGCEGLQGVGRGHGRLWEAERKRQQEAEAGSRGRQVSSLHTSPPLPAASPLCQLT